MSVWDCTYSVEENDPDDQENSDAADESEQEAARQRRTVRGHETVSSLDIVSRPILNYVRVGLYLFRQAFKSNRIAVS
jgi:hypothetical protein